MEADVVEPPPLWAADEGNIVRLVAAAQECPDDRLSISRHNAFRQVKAQHLGKQRQISVDVITVKQTVIKSRGLHAPKIFRLHLRVNGPETIADLLLRSKQLQRMTRRTDEAQTAPSRRH